VTFIYLVAIGVLVVVLVHIVVGWQVANGLRREALDVRQRTQNRGIWVRTVGNGVIDLESKEPRQDIGHPGVFGLVWDDGHARVGDVVGASDGHITRSFVPGPDGGPPVCEGSLEGCEPVGLDGYLFQSDPSDVGLAYEEVLYESPLGAMAAWHVPATEPGAWAIHCHGWTAERRELLRMLPAFHDGGRTSLVIDYRNDPGAPPDPTGRYRFGLSEWEDVEGAAEYAIEHGATDLVLMGCSTGAALVMSFLERSDLAGLVSGVVMDSPNIALVETFRQAMRPFRHPPLMKEMALWLTDLRWKVDWETTNYVPRAETILRVPALVFHGTSDQVVPIAVSRQLKARVGDLVELVETPAAGHVLSWNVNPEGYQAHLRGFLDRAR
jgi:alpha-beta hydrolase superfamily lysophospholipase